MSAADLQGLFAPATELNPAFVLHRVVEAGPNASLDLFCLHRKCGGWGSLWFDPNDAQTFAARLDTALWSDPNAHKAVLDGYAEAARDALGIKPQFILTDMGIGVAYGTAETMQTAEKIVQAWLAARGKQS